MVDVHSAILQLFVEKVDLVLEVVLLVDVLAQPFAQVAFFVA